MPSFRSVAAVLAVSTLGCSSPSTSPEPAPLGGRTGGPRPIEPGVAVTPRLPPTAAAELDHLTQAIKATAKVDTEGLLARYPLALAPSLGYDARAAINLPLIRRSALALTQPELDLLARDGLVISDAKRYPGFVYGYEAIYGQDLPVFISADSILHALHRSYDDILKAVEEVSLLRELNILIVAMRQRLSAGAAAAMGAEAERDADLYLAVAASLLQESTVLAPVRGASAGEIAALVREARVAGRPQDVQLFGVAMNIDFSQFAPRGHYQDTKELERYFKTMIWLGRTELPILYLDRETFTLKFSRRALAGAATLYALLDAEGRARWARIDQAIRAFAGEPDSMGPAQLGDLLAELGVTDPAALAEIDDAQIAQALVARRFGAQRIASQIVVAPPHTGTLPLTASFLLVGQRYVLDAHVFSNVVYDRVNLAGSPKRMMPNPLDVAFAALGNGQAARLLSPELERFGYAPQLAAMRTLADAHGDGYWNANLYNLWVTALRALSPRPTELTAAGRGGLPAIAATEAWGRRVLNTQLASWAELRRDTILYAKPSYTAGVACEFPDAYVDPYPEFFARVGMFARAGADAIERLDLGGAPELATPLRDYFQRLATVAGILREMAEHQRTGMPHARAHLDFINRAVKIQEICGADGASGWYTDLFFHPGKATEFAPTIADVHTQPTDENGKEVGRVLHVATGWPRLMVMTVDTCQGPRAYVGLVSAYHEKVTEQLRRLDDRQWAHEIRSASGPDVPWMKSLVVR